MIDLSDYVVVAPGTCEVSMADKDGFEAVYRVDTSDTTLAELVVADVINTIHRVRGQRRVGGGQKVQYDCIGALWLK